MKEDEVIYKEISKELLNSFFYNKKVFGKQERDEYGKVVFLTKYQSVDIVKINYALKNKIAYMSYQQDQSNLKWICLDFDIQKQVQEEDYKFLEDKVYRKRLLEDVNITIKKLKDLQISYVMEYSGNRGIHIWILFEEEISKAIAYTVIEKILENIQFKYTFKYDSGIVIDKYPKNGNAEGNKIGSGVKIPLSYHQKSGCYSYIIENTSDIKKIEILDTEFLKEQLNLLRNIKRNSIKDVVKKLEITKIYNNETFSRINGMIQEEYSLEQIINMLKKSEIFQKLFEKENLSEDERRIIVGTLIRLKCRFNPDYGKNILIEYFKKQKNYNEEITLAKIEKLKNLYPPTIYEVEKKLGIKCKYCEENNITNTMELIDGVEFIDFSKTNVLISWVIKAEKDYLAHNDEVSLAFISNDLEKLDTEKNRQEIEKEINDIKQGKNIELLVFYKYIRHEKEKDRVMYSYSAKHRVISTTIMFLIDDILGGEYTSSNGYSYKLNRNKYRNYKIFESWNYLWMNYKKDIEDKIYHEGYDNYYLIKLDLKGFYDSINHIFLRDYLYNKPTENIKGIIENLSTEEREEYKNLCEYLISLSEKTNPECGVPQGPAFARYLAEIYIYNIDTVIKNLLDPYTEFYFRYVDDMIILVESKEKVKQILDELNKKIEVLDLSLNYEKQIKDKVKNIKYEIIKDDIEKYFIDGIEEETPEFVKYKAKEMLQTMFEKIKKDETGKFDYKNLPFFLTHLIDEKYIKLNEKEIIENIINNNEGRGSMYKHFYNNIIFRSKVQNVDFYDKIEGLSRSNFINALLKNSEKVDVELLQKVLDTYIKLDNLQEYEKIELYMLVLQNKLFIDVQIVDSKLLLKCVQYTKVLRLSQDILHLIIVEIQKEDNKEKRLILLEEVLKKAEEMESITDYIVLIRSTIEQNKDTEYKNGETYQVVYNLLAFSTLYIEKHEQIEDIWTIFLKQYKDQKIQESQWYAYKNIIDKHKCNDSTIISFLTRELSGNHIISNKEITDIEMAYVATLIMYLSRKGINLYEKFANNEELKKNIKEFAKQKNMTILDWCIDSNSEYFPSNEMAILNSQYNNRIAILKNTTKLLVRGKKEIFEDDEDIQKEECSIDGEERYFRIYNIDDSIRNIYGLLEDKNIWEALSILEKIIGEIKEPEKIVNIFEKGSLNKKGEINLTLSNKDEKFVIDDGVIEKSIEDISRIIIERIFNKNKLKKFKSELGRIIDSKDFCKEFIPGRIKKNYEKLQFLFELNKNIKELHMRIENDDYEIERAKLATIKDSKLEILKMNTDYSNEYKVIFNYNTYDNSEDYKLLYGKVDIKKDNLLEIINTIKTSISKNINQSIIEEVCIQLENDLKSIEKVTEIKASKISAIEYEVDEDTIIIGEQKYNNNDIKIIHFGKKETQVLDLNEKQIFMLKSKKHIYFASNYIIVLPDFLEKSIEIIKKKSDEYDYNFSLEHINIVNYQNYDTAIKNIKLQNGIEKEEAERKLRKFLRRYEEECYPPIINWISEYKVIENDEMNKFVQKLKDYLDNEEYEVYSLKNYVDDRNGLDCILRKYDEDFDRYKKYDKKINRNLEEANQYSKKRIAIVSDIGISGGQFRNRMKEIAKNKKENDKILELSKYEEITLLNCIYTDIYEKNMKKNFEHLNLKFEGTKIKAKDYMYDEKMKQTDKDIIEKFFLYDINKKIMKKEMPYDNSITYKQYIDNIKEEDSKNVLVARYMSMPKAHHLIFDNEIFKYREDKK